jgi:hypothetical protein
MMQNYILYRLGDDGIGCTLLRFAYLNKVFPDKKIIISPESWCYFDNNYDYDEIAKVFNFHPKAILAPQVISKIKKEQILNPRATARKDSYEGLIESYNAKGLTAREIINSTEINEGNLLISLKEQPSMQFNISNLVGVHARLGNGELRADGTLIPRMNVLMETFIKYMRNFETNNFYVCSDTESFIELCKKEFGDRIKTQLRLYQPSGQGPGHIRKFRNYHINPVTHIKEAMIDIALLSKCTHLICNGSAFVKFAKSKIKKGNIKDVRREKFQ